jgi:hypothetical protein
LVGGHVKLVVAHHGIVVLLSLVVLILMVHPIVVIAHSRWSVLAWFVILDLRRRVLQLRVRPTHFIRVVVWELRREHDASLRVCHEWLFVVTDFIERKLHLRRHDQMVTIFYPHLSQTFGLSCDWLFAFNVNVHFFFLDKLPQIKVLDLS